MYLKQNDFYEIIKKFREMYPNYGISCDIINRDASSIFLQCTITDGTGNMRAKFYQHHNSNNVEKAQHDAILSAIKIVNPNL